MPDSFFDQLQQRLGPGFRLREDLPGGGMSRVFLAHESGLRRDVVVKVLPPDLVSSTSLARFRREIEVTARLQHPHILPVITTGGDEGVLYYITPFIHGRSLKARLDDGPLPPAEALRITRELLLAVRFAHERGVVHRDIKPGNVLLSDGHAILADFGIARALSDPDAPHPGPSGSSLAGSLAYLAPERPRDHTADLYAIGVLMREMLGGVDQGRLARRLRTLTERATAPTPALRFADAAEMLAALQMAEQGNGWPRPLLASAFVLGLTLTGAVGWSATHRTAEAGPVTTTVVRPARDPVVPSSLPPTLSRPLARSLRDSAAVLRQRGRSELAIPLLRRITEEAPRDARAWLALAQALTWSSLPADRGEARTAATRAADLASALDPHDALVARALLAQNEGRFPEACAAFDSARARRADFVTWFGAAECRARDDRVEPSAVGMRFRGDPIAAAAYYEEAWRRAEGVSPLAIAGRIQDVLPTRPGRVRRGTTATGEVWFGMAFADGDSIRWELRPAGPRRMTPELLAAAEEATRLARARLRPLLLAWVARDPRSAEAHRELAELLEADGAIASAGPDGVSALAEARRAVALSAAPELRLDAVRTEIRLLLRAGEWAAAATLSDSLLGANPAPDNVAAEFLIGPAAVTGQVDRAVALARQQGGMPQRQVRAADGAELPLPAAIASERIGFGIRAAAGICDESQRSAPARLMAALDVASPRATRPRGLEAAYLERSLMLALDCVEPGWVELLPQPVLPPIQVARAVLTGDSARARGLLAALDAARERTSPAPPTAEASLAEALARLLLADSAGARRVLGLGLDALPIAPVQLLHNEHPAAALPRVMALKAELDAAVGDTGSARRWATATLQLWHDPDPALGPAVARMRALARR